MVAQPAGCLHDVGVGVVDEQPGLVVGHPITPCARDRGATERSCARGWGPLRRRGSLPSPQPALVAQLERASDYGSEGWGFESLRARQNPLIRGHLACVSVLTGRAVR